MDGFAALVMLSVCLCWGFQQVAIKKALPGMLPVMQVGIRSAGAAVLVWGLMRFRGKTFSVSDGTFWPGALAGVLFGSTFLCIAVGLTLTTASHMSVFLYTAPVFTALGLHWLVAGEHLHADQWAGVFLAFAGIIVAFSDGFGGVYHAGANAVFGDTLGVLAGVLWAANTVVIRRSCLSEAAPTKTLLYHLIGGAVLLLAVAFTSAKARTISMTGVVWLSLVFQIVAVGFVSFLTWFWMLRRYLASRLTVFSFMTPIFGVAFGVSVLKEPLDARFVTGAVLVLAGIILVNRGRNGRKTTV